jgi:hypothetical protein
VNGRKNKKKKKRQKTKKASGGGRFHNYLTYRYLKIFTANISPGIHGRDKKRAVNFPYTSFRYHLSKAHTI